jgi:hypothetical protein
VRKKKQGRRNAEIAGRVEPQYTGSLHRDVALVSWSSVSPTGSALLAQDLHLEWTQRILRIYDLEAQSRVMYQLTGAAAGSWQAGRISAPAALSVQFYRRFTPPCPQAPALTCRPPGSPTPQRTVAREWVMTGVEINGVGLQVTTRDITVQEQVAGSFVKVSGAKAR